MNLTAPYNATHDTARHGNATPHKNILFLFILKR